MSSALPAASTCVHVCLCSVKEIMWRWWEPLKEQTMVSSVLKKSVYMTCVCSQKGCQGCCVRICWNKTVKTFVRFCFRPSVWGECRSLGRVNVCICVCLQGEWREGCSGLPAGSGHEDDRRAGGTEKHQPGSKSHGKTHTLNYNNDSYRAALSHFLSFEFFHVFPNFFSSLFFRTCHGRCGASPSWTCRPVWSCNPPWTLRSEPSRVSRMSWTRSKPTTSPQNGKNTLQQQLKSSFFYWFHWKHPG